MYVPKHFDPREFVDPVTWEKFGKRALRLFVDERVLITADQLREAFGPMAINNWHYWKPGHWSGNIRRWSGLRTEDCGIGSAYSQHRFGRACDAVFRDVAAEHVREVILDHPEYFPYINAIEENVSWLHYDVRNCARIFTFNA